MGVVRNPLSESVSGLPIKIAATGTPGTLIHTAVAGTTPGTFDEIYLYAWNQDSVVRSLVVEFGDANGPMTVPLDPIAGLVPILLGNSLRNGKTIRAYCLTANVIFVQGQVNSITA